jgi:hypothetical protein
VIAIPSPILRLFRVLGIDRAVAYSLMTQGWTLLSQPVTMLLLVHCLSEEEYGYFYAFGGIIAVQMFFDLGLGVVTLQFMSHEAAHLSLGADGKLQGDPTAKARMASLLRLSAIWYGTIACLLFFILLIPGWHLFSAKEELGVSWKIPWVWTVFIATSGGLTIPPYILLTACGRVAEMARLSGIQRVISNAIQWLALIFGAALLSWPLAQTVGFVFLGICIARPAWPALLDLARLPAGGPRVHWWREVWPLQWRIALGAPLAYLMTYLFTPVLFARDSVEAGQMGTSLAVMNALIAATIAWVGVRIPTFGHLIARRQWAELDRLFGRVFLISTLLSVTGAVSGFIVLFILQMKGYRLGLRCLPPLPLALLLANAVVQHMVHAMATYLRAHKKDPFFPLFVCFGMLMTVAIFTVGPRYGPLGMAAALLFLNTTICLGGGAYVWNRCRNAWHNPIRDGADAIGTGRQST